MVSFRIDRISFLWYIHFEDYAKREAQIMGKKVISGIIFFVLVAAVAGGMLFLDKQKEQEQMGALCGVWEMEVSVPREDVRSLLENNDFYDEEITLADLGTLSYLQTVTFREDGTYSFNVDKEASQALIDAFFRGMFQKLFAGRETLNEVYGVDFGQMDEAQFRQFYAELYETQDFEALIALFAENTLDLEGMQELETGSFKLKNGKIDFVTSSIDQEGVADYTIDGDKLTIEYIDGVEEYTRGK